MSLDPYDELAELVIIEAQRPKSTVAGVFNSRLRDLVASAGDTSDEGRRERIRVFLADNPGIAWTLVERLLPVPQAFSDFGRRLEPKDSDAADKAAKLAAIDSEWAREEGRRLVPPLQMTPTQYNELYDGMASLFDDQRIRDLIALQSAETNQERREKLRDFLYSNPGIANSIVSGVNPLPHFFVYLGRLAHPADEEAALRVARKAASDPEWAGEEADRLNAAVPFSLVFARELDEIDESRDWRSDLDPEVLIAEFRKPENVKRVRADLWTSARQLREEWHAGRVQETRLAELIDTYPEAFYDLNKLEQPDREEGTMEEIVRLTDSAEEALEKRDFHTAREDVIEAARMLRKRRDDLQGTVDKIYEEFREAMHAAEKSTR